MKVSMFRQEKQQYHQCCDPTILPPGSYSSNTEKLYSLRTLLLTALLIWFSLNGITEKYQADFKAHMMRHMLRYCRYAAKCVLRKEAQTDGPGTVPTSHFEYC